MHAVHGALREKGSGEVKSAPQRQLSLPIPNGCTYLWLGMPGARYLAHDWSWQGVGRVQAFHAKRQLPTAVAGWEGVRCEFVRSKPLSPIHSIYLRRGFFEDDPIKCARCAGAAVMAASSTSNSSNSSSSSSSSLSSALISSTTATSSSSEDH